MIDDDPDISINTGETTQERLAQLVADLRSLVEEAGALISVAAQEQSKDALAAIRRRMDAAKQRLAEIYDTTKQRALQTADQGRDLIRARPLQAVAIGAGVGVVVGYLYGRSGRTD